jgi:hypothetical protein
MNGHRCFAGSLKLCSAEQACGRDNNYQTLRYRIQPKSNLLIEISSTTRSQSTSIILRLALVHRSASDPAFDYDMEAFLKTLGVTSDIDTRIAAN